MLCLKLSSVDFQYVNERAAHVKIDRGVDLGCSNSLISPIVGWISNTAVL